jgi:heme A synthase
MWMGRLARFSWWVLGWAVVAILVGAVVRATGSGAGCGRSWPTCQGQVIPELAGATAIEFSHRAVSALSVLAVGLLVIGTMRVTNAGHPARRSVFASAGLIGIESALGLALVMYEWVAEDASVGRAVVVPAHLLNTLLLLAALTLSAFYLNGGARIRLHGRGLGYLGVGAVCLALIFATGAITALADTLFPSESLAAGLASDFSPTEHFLTRLRIAHPILAVATVLAALAGLRSRGLSAVAGAWGVMSIALIQLGVGGLNVMLGTPLWLQVVHLALADGLWIAYVLVAARVLSSPERRPSAVEAGVRQVNPSHT